MRRTGRRIAVIPLLALPLLGLAACGEEDGTVVGDGAVDPGMVARAAALDTSVEMVWVTDVPGYTLAVQSVGPLNAGGFQASYVSDQGGVLRLGVDRAPADTDDLCPVLSTGDGWFCATDGEVWTAAADDGSSALRARVDDGRLVSVTGDASVTGETLDEALAAAHQADADELAATLPEVPADQPPVERGDLPPNGDGAPIDPGSASG